MNLPFSAPSPPSSASSVLHPELGSVLPHSIPALILQTRHQRGRRCDRAGAETSLELPGFGVFRSQRSSLLLSPGRAKLPHSHGKQAPHRPGTALTSGSGALPVPLCQQELLEVEVQLLARGGPDGPHAVHAARLVPGVAGREDAADGGVPDRPAAGRCQHRARLSRAAFNSRQGGNSPRFPLGDPSIPRHRG